MVQAMKQEVFTVTAKSLNRYAEGYDFEVGKLGNNTTSGNISVFIHTICGEMLADSKNSDEICDEEVAHMQGNCN